MKLSPEHFDQMRAAIQRISPSLNGAAFSYQQLGHSPKRFRWDVLRASGLRAGDSVGQPTGWPVYDYANDDHIDTALRAVMREHGIEWAATK